MLVFIPDATPTVVVGDAVARHGVDETGQGDGSDELTTTKQTKEQVLHHVLCLVGISHTHRDEIDDFTTMPGIIVGYKFVVIH